MSAILITLGSLSSIGLVFCLALLDRLDNGETMAEIARDLGITRERVRQLVMRYVMPPPKEDQTDG